MYIPAENVYYEIIARDDENGETVSLAALALRKKVIPVSPNTFYAYLNTILLGLRGLKVERFAKEILNNVGRIRTEIERFAGEFATVGKHIKNAASAYNEADKKLTRINDRLVSFEHPEIAEVSEPEKLTGEQSAPSVHLPL
ncbi:MAG: DNA recombination protein RmuC, partial [Deltaproteobacteria bacterium]|nr:DNA recombination protein RmuC [Deltaproteobacteria bacterium]